MYYELKTCCGSNFFFCSWKAKFFTVELHREYTTVTTNMNSCYFKWVLPLKNLQQENSFKFTWLPFISTSCTVDSTFYTITESNMSVKSCKVHMKSEWKKMSYWIFTGLFISVCTFSVDISCVSLTLFGKQEENFCLTILVLYPVFLTFLIY